MNPFILPTIFMSMILFSCSQWEEPERTKAPPKAISETSPEEPDINSEVETETNGESGKRGGEEAGKGIGEGEGTQEPPSHDKGAEFSEGPETYIIFEGEMVDKQVFVGHVKAGDEILVRLQGVKITRRFSEVYKKNVTSVWTELECDNSHPFEGKNSKIRDCIEVYQSGECTASFRDDTGKVESPIEFEEQPESIPLYFILGGRSYRSDKIKLHGGSSVTVSLKVTAGMVEKTDKLYIRPIHTFNGHIKTGFLEYGSCQGRGKKDFHAMEATDSHEIPNNVIRSFQVDLKLIRNQAPP